MKKIIALLLSAVLTMTCLAGCGGNGNKTSADGVKEPYKHFNATGYPVVDEQITLTVMVAVDTTRSSGLNDNPIILEIEKLTGVDLEFIEVSTTEWSEELSLTLASGDLPDIIAGSMSSSDLASSIKAGTIIDLKPYIESYGENIKATMNVIDSMEQTITLSSGEIASLPYINFSTEEGNSCPQGMLYVYQPWLDKLGLEAPDTAQELYDVLKAFKTKDPNGNGKADEIPFLPRILERFYDLFSLFGIVVQEGSYLQEVDGKIMFTPSMPNFKEGLTYLRTLYKEGLVNEKVFTDKPANTIAKGSGETAVAGVVCGEAAFAVVGEKRQEEMTLIPYIAAEGYNMAWLERQVVSEGKFMITKDCKYPEVALRVWDYFFSEEGSSLYWMGTEDNYTWNEDRTSWTWNLKGGQTIEEIRAEKTLQTSSLFASKFSHNWFKQVGGSESVANEGRNIMGTQYGDYLRSAVPSWIQYESGVALERSILLADINLYVDECLAKFITGEMDIEKDWDAFMKQCETLEVDEVLRMTQEAYDAAK